MRKDLKSMISKRMNNINSARHFHAKKATLHTSFWTQTLTCMSTSKGFCDDLLHRMLTLILYGFSVRDFALRDRH